LGGIFVIDRLHDVLPYLEQLPPEAQGEAASYIEVLAEALERWEDPVGAWRDLPDTMLEELDQLLRHANPPTPPLEYL
jgi:hypothetical protein